MAEWLCSGLQSRVRRFDSDFRLQIKPHGGVAECLCDKGCNPYTGRLKSAPPPPSSISSSLSKTEIRGYRPGGEIGRHNGLKIRRP